MAQTARTLKRELEQRHGRDRGGPRNAAQGDHQRLNDPERQFIPLQNKLARDDLLSEYLQHRGSGIWAIFPGIDEGESIGERLLA